MELLCVLHRVIKGANCDQKPGFNILSRGIACFSEATIV